MDGISSTIALGAGFLSFFSPCILPLIPAYIMYVTDVSIEEELTKEKLFALKRTMGFIIGFTFIFILMGTSASFLGTLFIRNKNIFSKLSGILIIFFGLKMMGVIHLGFLNKDRRLRMPTTIKGWGGSVLVGISFAAGWTPCFGPALASILVYSGNTNTVYKGMYLLLIYSIGMAIPFIITTLFISNFNKFLVKTEGLIKYVPKVSGCIIVIFGLLVFFDKVVNISRLLL